MKTQEFHIERELSNYLDDYDRKEKEALELEEHYSSLFYEEMERIRMKFHTHSEYLNEKSKKLYDQIDEFV